MKHNVLCYKVILMSVLMLFHEGAGAVTTSKKPMTNVEGHP